MKLSLVQSVWLIAVAALFAAMLLDIFGVLEVPPLYWFAGIALLFLTGAWIMPSLDRIRKAQRTPRR